MNQTAGEGAPAAQAWPSAKVQRRTLFVLTVVVMFTVLDRQVMALMIEPMKQDFGVTDTQAALLLGAAFSLTYAIAGLPIARIADTWNRRNIVAISIAFWSLATMACGIAQSYTQMFIARLSIGIGESGYGPATWSMVTDTYPRERVAFATSILSVGALVGTGLALLLGGVALAFVAHLPPIDLPLVGTIRNWQWAFVIVGAPGLVWALVVLSLREPLRRGLAQAGKRSSLPVMEVVRYVAHDWRTYTAVIGGTAMKYLMTLGTSQWMPSLLRREFGWELSQIGMVQGTITLIAAPLGLVAGGKLAERWAKQGRSDTNLRIMFYSLCLAVPLYVVMPLLQGPWLVLAVFAVVLFIAALGTGPAVAAFQVITPNRMRAQVSSVSQFCTNVLAFALGPLIVALFTDYLFDDPRDLKYSMSLSVAILGPIAILIVWQGLKSYARSYERTAREFAN
jgi:MFS family permease